MVYESDFYTTRRPYTSASSRPYVSSYSVSVNRSLLHPHPHMPYPAHKRLVRIVHAPVRIYHAGTYLPIKIHSRVRPSIIAAELNRIRYLTRPSSVSYTENYLNSKDYIDFDDETREIRAKTDNLLRRIHVFIPRPSLSDYDETSPEKLRSDDYVRRIINAKNSRKDIESLPWYSTPEKRDIGQGHLACIKYAGGRAQSKRRSYYTVGDLVPGDVKTDVKLMSYYMKNRKAADEASLPSVHHHVPRTYHTHDAPAATVTWADEVVREKEIPEETEQPQQQQQQQQQEQTQPTEAEVQLTQPEAIDKPSEKKNEKKVRVDEKVESDDPEAEYDEDGVRKHPSDDTIKKVHEYLEKKTAEKKLEEERREWEAAERKRIQEEKELAKLAALKLEHDQRMAEIREQERLEAERQEAQRRADEARQEAERLVEEQKLFNEAIMQAVADEAERIAQEEEELRNREEGETNVEQFGTDCDEEPTIDDSKIEENFLHEQSEQEDEAKHSEADHEDDTQIEEDEHPEEQVEEKVEEEPEEAADELESPFPDPQGSTSSPQVDEPVLEDSPTVKVSGGAGGEQGFDWSEFDNEPEAEEQVEQELAPQVEEAEEQPQAFDESEAASQASADEAQIDDVHVKEEAQVTEAQLEDSLLTEEEAEETRDEEAHEAEQTQVDEDRQSEGVHIEEIEDTEEDVKSEEKSAHEASDEEEHEEE